MNGHPAVYVWISTKEKTLADGWAAGICPRCNAITRCAAQRDCEYLMLYWVIPLFRRTTDSYLVCDSCYLRFLYDKAEVRPTKNEVSDLDDLILATNPRAKERLAALETRQARMEAGLLEDEERVDALAAVFLEMDDLVKARMSQMHIDAVAGVWLTLAGFVTVIGTILLVNGASPKPIKGAIIGALVVCWVVTAAALVTDVRRYMRKRIIPQIAGALLELDPSVEDLRAVRRRLRRMRAGMWKTIRPGPIVLQLAKIRHDQERHVSL